MLKSLQCPAPAASQAIRAAKYCACKLLPVRPLLLALLCLPVSGLFVARNGDATAATTTLTNGCAVSARGIPSCGGYTGGAYGANSDPATWNEEIYTTNQDGSRGPVRITNTPENDHWPPSWAPSGDWFAYTNDRGREGSRIAIVVGTGEPRYLTDGAYDLFPAWRPEPAS